MTLCRHCRAPLSLNFADLGAAPPSNSYLTASDLSNPEIYFPLNVKVCDQCWLVQTIDYAEPNLFFNSNYAYFSSASSSWLDHSNKLSSELIKEFKLTKDSFVVEIASNDGYLLKNFVSAGIRCLGVEPSKNTAKAARQNGIPVREEFFTAKEAKILRATEGAADIIIGNNVYAHVPDINDFTDGLRLLLSDEGSIVLEFPHLLELINNSQFDTIYHEHFSYLSLTAVAQIFNKCGLRIYDVKKINTHGGSLRVYGCLSSSRRKEKASVSRLLDRERLSGLLNSYTYSSFQAKIQKIKNKFVSFLLQQKREGKIVVGYGAAAKGNTLINYAGIKPDLIEFVCDIAPSKQGKYLPGSRIPIVPPAYLECRKPDVVIIFPWNIADEILDQNKSLIKDGTKFVTFIPRLKYHV